ncbi:MAG: FTR1 family protein [Proteobacteria bacterium]|nr:FTR1 family protein [Pseudomonadota bacterium]
MLVSLIIVFREALEAGLIVGIILAATQGANGRGRWIAGGIGAGVAGSMLVAAFAAALSEAFEGVGQEIFTASILLFAVVMLTWHIIWMSHHARTMAAELRQVGNEVRMGQKTLLALAAVIAVAVMREGSEVVLFLFGIAASSQTSQLAMLAGGVSGLALAAVMSWLLYRGLLVIPLKWLFAVTNVLIAFLAAGMAATAVGVLQGADILPAWGDQVWNTSWLLDESGLAGKTLHALIGYTARPSGIQVVAWVGTLAVLWLLARVVSRQPVARRVAAAAGIAALLAVGTPARAEDTFSLTIRNHRFEPDRLEVPANTKFKLQVKNTDAAAEEFESHSLKREKIVPAGGTVTLSIGPLKPGEYKFFGEYHESTAQGVLVAK